MSHEVLKLELIHWLTKLDDKSTIEYLRIVKESLEVKNDWWSDLNSAQRESIERGLQEVKEGRLRSHDDVKSKYGL